MCLIIASPTGRPIPADILTHSYNTNSHGAGIAWFEGGKVKWKKGLNLDEFLKLAASMKTPHVTHTRIASIGPTIPELTHPFPICPTGNGPLAGSARAVLFQNGTWSAWEDKLVSVLLANRVTDVPAPPWSDSRALAVMVHYCGPNILHLLNNSSRFVIMDSAATGEGAKPGKMIFVGGFSEKDGFYYSHEGSCAFWKPVAPVTQRSATTYQSRDRRSCSLAATVPKDFPLWEKFTPAGLEKAPVTA